ncbi:MAG: DUF3105 domain-containing protein [Catenulispora sp.]|nr:DUF3105 domain-containing protein [Catenulispora sp.]
MAKNGTSRVRAADARARVAQARAEQQARAKRRKLIWNSAIGALVLVLIGGITFAVLAGKDAGKIAGVKTFGKLTQNHVETDVVYPQTPPVGGDHNPVFLNCGIYKDPVKNENAVHSLEHGAVWITYQPGIGQAQIAALKAAAAGKSYVVLSPYPTQPAPVTVSAWSTQLTLDSATDPRLAEFIAEYMQGPQTPEPGAPCSGGTGTPTG